MESRVHALMEEHLAAMDRRVAEALKDRGIQADAELIASLRGLVSDAVREAVDTVRKGKTVHERFVQHVVLHAVDAIIGVDRDERIFFWNKGAEQTFGYTQDEVLDRNFDFLIPAGDEHRDELAELHARTWSAGFIRDHHTQRMTRDGRVLMVSLSRTLLRDEQGNALGVIAILRDMTEKRRLERQIAHNEKLALIGQIAAGIAHEIGAPLNIISGIAEMLLMDRPEGDPECEDLQTVIGQTERIARLIRELLAFARPQPLRRDMVDIGAELRRALGLVKGRLSADGIEADIETAPGLPLIEADSHQLQQVFLNLIINAADAISGESGRKESRIAISVTSPEDGVLELRFSDSGPGIGPDILPRVFEPFVTSKETGKGTGLGLAVCRRIIEEHQGGITAANGKEGGAVFTIRFPVKAG